MMRLGSDVTITASQMIEQDGLAAEQRNIPFLKHQQLLQPYNNQVNDQVK